MAELYLYNNGRRDDVLLSRPLYHAIAREGHHDISIGVCRDDAYLLEDLVGDHVRLLRSDYANSWTGAGLDLLHLQPQGTTALHTSLTTYEDTLGYQWSDVLEVFHSQLREVHVTVALPCEATRVPMLDFTAARPEYELLHPTIYLDSRRSACRDCHFVFDLERLLELLPHHDFACTAPPPFVHDRLLDVSELDLIALSYLSNACDVLLGMTRDPFACTLTEPNRFKPKAMCGYDARVHRPFWDYPGNPLELLGTMDQVADFLLSNCFEAVR